MNTLKAIENLGQSIWLDYISRPLLDQGELKALIENDHLKGVTSNPSIFEKAISKTSDYEKSIEALSQKGITETKAVYEALAIKDIQDACDLLRPIHENTHGTDGFACLEVSPHLANDAEKTIEEGTRLWREVNRPNLMIKVPGTKEGMKAIRALISQGIHVNVTLLFSVDSYEQAALAHLHGLKERADRGQSLSIHSVASFFISRIDSKLDAMLEKIDSKDLQGKVAIANAKLAYIKFQEIYQSDLAKELLKKGAPCQRLLWASTSTKNKNYSDVLYVESLIGKHTVNTLPLETLVAFRDHGQAYSTLTEDLHEAPKVMAQLSSLGIDFNQCSKELLHEGIKLFNDAFDQLLDSVSKKLALIKAGKQRDSSKNR